MENKQEVQKPKKKKTTSIVIGSILILLIIIAGGWWYINHSEYVTTDDAYVDAYKVTISSQIPGRITKLYIHQGDKVKKGELVAVLDSSDYVARIQQVSAGLKEAQLGIKLAQVRLSQATINFERARKQYLSKLIPKASYQNLQKAYEAAKVGLALAKAKIPVIKSSVNTLKTTLSYTKIYAPMQGVAAKRWVLAGDVVGPGQGIFTVFNTDKQWVTAMLPEGDLQKIHIGDTAEIHVDAFPKTSFKGVIYQFGNSTASQFSLIPPNNASGNFTKVSQRIPIRLTIFETDNKTTAKGKLLPGMSVEIKVKIKKHGSTAK